MVETLKISYLGYILLHEIKPLHQSYCGLNEVFKQGPSFETCNSIEVQSPMHCQIREEDLHPRSLKLQLLFLAEVLSSPASTMLQAQGAP